MCKFNFLRKALTGCLVMAGLTVQAASVCDCNGCCACGVDTLRFHYASRAEAQALWSVEDAYMRHLSPFDLEVRTGKSDAGKVALKQIAMAGFRDWTADEMKRMDHLMITLNARIRQEHYDLPLPDSIVIVKSDMEEEGGAGGYTRSKWIALHSSMPAKDSEDKLEEVMLHELFHVLTRNNPDFKRKVYETIGFTVEDNELDFPEDLRPVHITNPDVDRFDSYATFRINGSDQRCAMVIYAARPYSGGSLFDYLKIGFVALDENLKPVMKDGRTVVYPLEKVENFYDQIGRNTDYVINPEEILAENFVFAFQNRSDLKTPDLRDRIRNVIKSKKN